MQGITYAGYQSYGNSPFSNAAAQTYWPESHPTGMLGSYSLSSSCSAEAANAMPRASDMYAAAGDTLKNHTEHSDSEQDAPLSGSFDECNFNINVKLEEQVDPVGALMTMDNAAFVKKEGILAKEEHSSGSGSASTSPRGDVVQNFGATTGAPFGTLHAADIAIIFRSQYRGVSYDKKKRKWRVQIKVASLGKSGVSVGYFDTEEAAARAYDKAAIGLLGREQCRSILNFPIEEYDVNKVPQLVGKTREEVKATLKNERAKIPRRRLTHRRRTSRYLGVGSSNRKNQWQARILYHGKVTHLGYYRTEEEAARVYDRVSISLHGEHAQTNFPLEQYAGDVAKLRGQLAGLSREELQRSLGVKPMDKSSRYRGVSKKKGKWEAKVMLNRKWAYRELFDTEAEAAHAYDAAVWRLKPREARSYVNFKNSCPADVAELLQSGGGADVGVTAQGIPLTAQPLLEAGLLFHEDSPVSDPTDSIPPRSPNFSGSSSDRAAAAAAAGPEMTSAKMQRSFSHHTLFPSSGSPPSSQHQHQQHQHQQPPQQQSFTRQLSLPTCLPRGPPSSAAPTSNPPTLMLPSYPHTSTPISSTGPMKLPLARHNSTSSCTSTFIPPSPLGSPTSPLLMPNSSPSYPTSSHHLQGPPGSLMVRVGSETHFIPAQQPQGLHHVASESHLSHLLSSTPHNAYFHPQPPTPHHSQQQQQQQQHYLSSIAEHRASSLPQPSHPHHHNPPPSWHATNAHPQPSQLPSLSNPSPPITPTYSNLPWPIHPPTPSSALSHPSHPSSCPPPPSPLHHSSWNPSSLSCSAPAPPPFFPAALDDYTLHDMMDILPSSLLDLLPDPTEPDLHHDFFPGDDLDEAFDHDLPSPPSSPTTASAAACAFFRSP